MDAADAPGNRGALEWVRGGYHRPMDEWTLRADRFGVLQGEQGCHRCGAITRVSGLIVPGYEDRDDPGEEWTRVHESSLLSYVTAIDAAALAEWQRMAPWIEFRRSGTAEMSYYANVCEHCGALQGDHYLTEAGEVFFPANEEAFLTLPVVWCDIPLRADAGGRQCGLDELFVERNPPPGWRELQAERQAAKAAARAEEFSAKAEARKAKMSFARAAKRDGK
jgi:hypothetical protein